LPEAKSVILFSKIYPHVVSFFELRDGSELKPHHPKYLSN
jgi:hypothetical protein